MLVQKPQIVYLFFFLMIRHPPRSPLFPYTPLFRSNRAHVRASIEDSRRQCPLSLREPLGYRLDRAREDRRLANAKQRARSEEHTSELQSQSNLVCRLLLEKKNMRLRLQTNARHYVS